MGATSLAWLLGASGCRPLAAEAHALPFPDPVILPSSAHHAPGVPPLRRCWHRALPGAVPTEIDVSTEGIAIVGEFTGTADFGLGPLKASPPKSDGWPAPDAFVARYRLDGGFQWARVLGGPYDDRGTGVALDAAGRTTVVGTFIATIDLGGGVRPCRGVPVRGRAGFIANYGDGDWHRWDGIHGARNSIAGDAIAVDRDGNLNVVGSSMQGVGFVAAFGPDGALRWRHRFIQDDRDHTQVHAVALDPIGNVYVTGSLSGASDLGGGTRRVAQDQVAGFVACYTPAGEHRWDRVFGAPWAIPTEIAVGPKGEATVAGSTFGATADGETSQIFLAHFEADGTRTWDRHIDTMLSYAADIAADLDGAVYVVGEFEEQIDLGAGVRRAGDDDTAFVVSYGRDGDHRWDRTFVAIDPMRDGERRVGRSAASAVTVRRNGTVVVAGHYVGDLDVGDGERLPSAPGTRNGFVVSLSPACP